MEDFGAVRAADRLELAGNLRSSPDSVRAAGKTRHVHFRN
jgi:hypothetical protein